MPGHTPCWRYVTVSIGRPISPRRTACSTHAVDLARKSVDLDENDGLCHDILGQIYVNRRLFDLAERHFQRALALNPNRSTLMGSFGWACGYLGKPEQGITYLENARLIDPYFEPSWYWRVRGVVHFTARQYEEAVAALGRSTNRRSIRTLVFLAASLAQLDRHAEAQECKREVLQVAPRFFYRGLHGTPAFPARCRQETSSRCPTQSRHARMMSNVRAPSDTKRDPCESSGRLENHRGNRHLPLAFVILLLTVSEQRVSSVRLPSYVIIMEASYPENLFASMFTAEGGTMQGSFPDPLMGPNAK